MIDFENIEEKLNLVCKSEDWKTLVDKFRSSKRVYLIGNGGLHFTDAHAATDCTGLIPNKTVH